MRCTETALAKLLTPAQLAQIERESKYRVITLDEGGDPVTDQPASR